MTALREIRVYYLKLSQNVWPRSRKYAIRVLEPKLLALKLDDLSNLANEMKLDKSSIEGKSKFSILKSVCKEIEEKVGNLAEKAKIIEYLDNIKTFLGLPPLEENTEEPKIIEKSPEESKIIEKSHEEQHVLELQEQIKKLRS